MKEIKLIVSDEVFEKWKQSVQIKSMMGDGLSTPYSQISAMIIEAIEKGEKEINLIVKKRVKKKKVIK